MSEYSVLMSVYSKENPTYLEQAIESILTQTLPTEDFVLVCDGPLTEELEQVIKKYEGQLHILRLEHNQGLGEALRQGLPHCRCELVARADSDDISAPDRCRKQVEWMQKNPKLSLISAAVSEFQQNTSEITGFRRVPATHEEIKAFSKKRNPFNHPAMMFRKSEVLKAGNYRSEFPYFEDYDLWVRMLQGGAAAANLPEPLVYMRTSPDLYLRRGGKAYAGYMWRFKSWMRRSGWTTRREFLQSTLPHVIVCMLPNGMRKQIYQKLHGKQKEE